MGAVMREIQLQPGAVHGRPVALDGALVLAHQRRLRVELLAGDRILLVERLVALQVAARVFQLRQVLLLLALRLRQRHLEGPRVDLRQQIAGLDVLAFLERHLDQFAIDAAAHRHGVVGGRRAQRPQDDLDILGAGLAHAHRHRHVHHRGRAAAHGAAAAGPALLPARVLRPQPPGQGQDGQDGDRGCDQAAAPLAGRRRNGTAFRHEVSGKTARSRYFPPDRPKLAVCRALLK